MFGIYGTVSNSFYLLNPLYFLGGLREQAAVPAVLSAGALRGAAGHARPQDPGGPGQASRSHPPAGHRYIGWQSRLFRRNRYLKWQSRLFRRI
jgi:hypothetical protein